MTEIKQKNRTVKAVDIGSPRGNGGKFLKGVDYSTPRKSKRNKLTGQFIEALALDFEANGAKAIAACRMFDPASYLKLIAGLLPREVVVRPEEEMPDDELTIQIKRLLALDLEPLIEGREDRPFKIIEGTRAPDKAQ